ncbi:MAG: nickel pincer cofactor biosynthesis protein LarB [Atopobiaceae bacterium]|nr:nickel pincer cofactor biosynthesis protein LarB [Atopobiaceae bacterium]MBR1828157.1 nickel pincer cofactor biosynthesis protein LarB [Atopobiaceae bacterium]
MEDRALRALLEQVAQGTVSTEEARAQIAHGSFEDLGYAKPDLDRGRRQGVSEVIYGAGKTAEQIAGIVASLRRGGEDHVMITRLDAQKEAEVRVLLSPEDAKAFAYHELPRVGTVGDAPAPDGVGYIAVAAAGTSDLYCAEEAAITAEMLGSRVVRLYDVGVAGIHRLLAHVDEIRGASAVVAVAGMEGALASVVGGLVPCPVIACPTSVGYGASFGGISALLAMLNSCASGVSVVNIDNGFGAGYQAALIDHVGRA